MQPIAFDDSLWYAVVEKGQADAGIVANSTYVNPVVVLQFPLFWTLG